MDRLLEFAAKEMTKENSLDEIPTKDSPFYEKLIFGLKFVDSYFGSNVFRKVMNGETQVLEKTYSTLPTVHIAGNLETIHELEQSCCKKRTKKSQPRNWFGE